VRYSDSQLHSRTHIKNVAVQSHVQATIIIIWRGRVGWRGGVSNSGTFWKAWRKQATIDQYLLSLSGWWLTLTPSASQNLGILTNIQSQPFLFAQITYIIESSSPQFVAEIREWQEVCVSANGHMTNIFFFFFFFLNQHLYTATCS
jgi:hypothetical protein